MPQPDQVHPDRDVLGAGAPTNTAAAAAVVRIHPRAAWRNVGGEVFVITGDRAFHRLAAPTAVDLIKRLAAAPATVSELAELLVRDYQVDAATACLDVTTFVDTLLAKQIATANEPTGGRL